MAHSIEVLPDPDAEADVRRAWARLADAELPSLAAHRHPTNRPHLTLAVADRLPAAAVDRVAGALAALPIPLRLPAVAVFPGRSRVLYAAVTASPALVALHEEVVAALVEAGAEVADRFRPGRWVPHCTLAVRLGSGQAGRGVEELADWPPVEGSWVAARTYDTVSREVSEVT